MVTAAASFLGAIVIFFEMGHYKKVSEGLFRTEFAALFQNGSHAKLYYGTNLTKILSRPLGSGMLKTKMIFKDFAKNQPFLFPNSHQTAKKNDPHHG